MNGILMLSPGDVAREACVWVMHQRDRYQALLRASGTPAPTDAPVLATGFDATLTHVGETVHALMRYATHGELGPFTGPRDVANSVEALLEAIQHRECGKLPDLPESVWKVLHAALGRARLAHGLHVSPQHLAALGDVTPGRIRQLAREGEELERDAEVRGYRSDAGMITAASAIRWLEAHGVRITPEAA